MDEESITEGIEKACLAYFSGRRKKSAGFSGQLVPGQSTGAPSGDLSWLAKLPKTLDNDRQWFPDNTPFELEEERMMRKSAKSNVSPKGGKKNV